MPDADSKAGTFDTLITEDGRGVEVYILEDTPEVMLVQIVGSTDVITLQKPHHGDGPGSQGGTA